MRPLLLLLPLLLLGQTSAQTVISRGAAHITGHAAGTFGGTGDIGGPVGGVAWGPNGTAYTLDGAQILHRWDVSTGRSLSRQVLWPPASVPGARDPAFGPRLFLDGTVLDGPGLEGTLGTAAGLLVRVTGIQNDQPYRTAFTLTPDGRRVLGDPCPSSERRLRGCIRVGRLTVQDRTEAGATAPQTPPLELIYKDPATGKTLTTRPDPPPDGARLILGELGSGASRIPASTVTLPRGEVLRVVPSPDGSRTAVLRLVTPRPSWGAGTAYVDVVQRKGGKRVSWPLPGTTLAEAAAPDLRWVGNSRLLTATAEQDPATGGALSGQIVALRDALTGRARWKLSTTAGLVGAVPSPDGRLWLTVRGGSVPEVRRVSDGQFVRVLGRAVVAWVPLAGSVSSSGRAAVALSVGGGAGALSLLDRAGREVPLAGGAARWRFAVPGVPDALAATPDGGRFALAVPGALYLLDSTGRLRQTLKLPGLRVMTLTFGTGGVLSARANDSALGGERTLAWRLDSAGQLKPLVLPPLPDGSRYSLPISALLLREDVRRPAQTGPLQSRLSVLNLAGGLRWQDAWGPETAALVSPDGHTVLRARGIAIPGQIEVQALKLYLADARTGQARPPLTLSPLALKFYRGLGVADFAPSRRHVLLTERDGDGCGGALYGVRLADLQTRQELPLPAAFGTGLTRFFGCGHPRPVPETVFAPDGKHILIRDGNALKWWAGAFGLGR
ncbi:hypothetical protein [Deinococcus sp. QL22]|uniref:hypothetical protein n=1 Tax=Deinococcus sp. QL22 TaxID=2939437 RepID=UPI002016EEAE|nr:hypothetical protein [Deinococcus sp. QL22]UQN05058.1 hypothetical protein M1R55_09070 [Deinococcus sp. QL22]